MQIIMLVVYIILGFIAFFMIMQVIQVQLSKKSKGVKISGLEAPLSVLERKGVKGLVYFHSPSCHACKSITPVIQELKTQHKNIYDIDISINRNALDVFGVKATPTTMIVEDGIITNVILGARSKSFLKNLITW